MRTLLLALAASTALFLPAVAQAQVITEDPLHGFGSNGGNEQTIGGNAVTPTNSVVNFGFNISPPDQTGDLVLKFLIPNDFTLAQVQTFAATVDVTGGNPSPQALSLFSTTSWTSGNLVDFLGIAGNLANGAPKNPLDAFIGATNTEQPTATGYYVLLADVGTQMLSGPNATPNQFFSLSPAVYASGGLILGDLNTSAGDVTTAQSGALFFDGPSGGPFCTNCNVNGAPGPEVATGVPGALAAMIVGGFMWYRRRRLTAA